MIYNDEITARLDQISGTIIFAENKTRLQTLAINFADSIEKFASLNQSCLYQKKLFY